MDVLASDIPSLKDVPISHFNYAVNEVQGRLKVLSSVSSFVDDISEVENNVSKALSKVRISNFAKLFDLIIHYTQIGWTSALYILKNRYIYWFWKFDRKYISLSHVDKRKKLLSICDVS